MTGLPLRLDGLDLTRTRVRADFYFPDRGKLCTEMQSTWSVRRPDGPKIFFCGGSEQRAQILRPARHSRKVTTHQSDHRQPPS